VTTEVEELRTKVVEMEAAERVRRAAADWHSPEDAVHLLKGEGRLADVTTDVDARQAVSQAAARTPQFVKSSGSAPTPRDEQLFTAEQLLAFDKVEIEKLKRGPDAARYWASVDAFGRKPRYPRS
jgi:hypothetical protein